jgi:hypothetical protein
MQIYVAAALLCFFILIASHNIDNFQNESF